MGPEPIVINGVKWVASINGRKFVGNWGYTPMNGIITLRITGRGPPCTAGVLVGRILNHHDTTHQCHISISESWEACPLNGIRIGSVSAPWNMVGLTYDYIIWWGVRWFGYLKSLCAKDLDINTQILNIDIYIYIHVYIKYVNVNINIYIYTVYRLFFIHRTYTYDFVNM